LTNGKAVAGCVGDTPPAGFVADNTDCDDGDANAHPGQTAFFPTTSAGVHTFDYNCDGTLEKGIDEDVGGSCGFCGSNGSMFCAHNAGCGTAGIQSYLYCFGIIRPPPFPPICRASGTGSFFGTVNCGIAATFINCGTCSVNGGGPNNSTSTVTQTCH
jgi:hypothetical protein